jgi:hypothetical protein
MCGSLDDGVGETDGGNPSLDLSWGAGDGDGRGLFDDEGRK